MTVNIDFAMITALRADYKRQKIVVTIECSISRETMEQMPEISRWAAYDQPVSIEIEKIQQEIPWLPAAAKSAGASA